jgi:peptidylprolyl isomerase
MAFKEGDFVLVEYTVKIKETQEIVDTTNEEEARKAGIYDAKERYGPRLVIVGEGRLIAGLEEAITQLSVGEEKSVTIPPEKAFGKRDPNKIKIIPRSQFIKSGVAPEPGKVVEINGQLAVIRSVTSGRVIVDFNHPLAGKTLEARVKAVKKLEDVREKVLYLLLRRLPALISENDVKVEYTPEDKYVKVNLNEKALLVQDMQNIKRIVVSEIGKYMRPDVDKIDFIEKISLAVKQQEEKEKKEEAKTVSEKQSTSQEA